MFSAVLDWMSWHDGVDLCAHTTPGQTDFHLLVHVARMVHTPAGSAPAGLIWLQPDPDAAPVFAGFLCADAAIGAYFGPHLFAGTPFERAPVLRASITIDTTLPGQLLAVVATGGRVIRVSLTDLAPLTLVNRPPASAAPFFQLGTEAAAGRARLWLDEQEIPLVLPATGLAGGPPAVWSPCGIYTR